MIKIGGNNFIGLFEGLPYGDCTERIDDYKRNDCKIDRVKVLARLESLDAALTSEPTYDLFTGEQFMAGLCDDGSYIFTTDFIRYYKQGIVDIPREYEEYLITKKLVA